MNFVLEHGQIILAIATMFIGIVITWTKMSMRLQEIEAKLTENRQAMKEEFGRLQQDLNTDLSRFKLEHDVCRQSVIGHHENSALHMSAQERDLVRDWRLDLTKRLDRIEQMVSLILKNGIDKDVNAI